MDRVRTGILPYLASTFHAICGFLENHGLGFFQFSLVSLACLSIQAFVPDLSFQLFIGNRRKCLRL